MDVLTMLQSLPRASLVSLLSGVRVPASPSASDLTLRAIATSLHELGTLDENVIVSEWESLQ